VTALIAIVFLHIAVFLALRFFAPRALRSSLGRSEFAAAIALPVLATFGGAYVILVIGVLAIIIGFPALFGGAVDRQLHLEQRLRLGFFAVPLLPIFYRDVTISSFTVAQLNYVILICGALVGAMVASGIRMPNTRLATWDATFAAMMVAQLFMEVRGDDLLFLIRTTLHLTLTLAMPYFVFSRAIAISANPPRLLLAMLLATAAIAVLALFESTRTWLLYDYMNTSIGANLETISGYTKLRGNMLRPRATWPDSTSLSLFLAVMLVMLYAIRRQIGSRRFVRVLAAMLLTGLFISFARVGYLALVVGLAACFIYERRYRRLAVLIGVGPVAALGLVALAVVFPIVGTSIGLSSDAAGTADYRDMLNRDGLALWRSNWLIGLSIRDILFNLAHLTQGEGIVDLVNQPLTILMRGGVVFATLYYALSFRLLGTLFARRRHMDDQTRAIACGVFAGILAITAGLLTTSYLRNESTFIILLGIGAGAAARRTAKQAQSLPGTVFPTAETTPAVLGTGILQGGRRKPPVPITKPFHGRS